MAGAPPPISRNNKPPPLVSRDNKPVFDALNQLHPSTPSAGQVAPPPVPSRLQTPLSVTLASSASTPSSVSTTSTTGSSTGDGSSAGSQQGSEAESGAWGFLRAGFGKAAEQLKTVAFNSAVAYANEFMLMPATNLSITKNEMALLEEATKAAYMSLAIYQTGKESLLALAKSRGGELHNYMLQEELTNVTNFAIVTSCYEFQPSEFDSLLHKFEKVAARTTEDDHNLVLKPSEGMNEEKVTTPHVSDSKTIYVVFRGSSSTRDWFINFTAAPTRIHDQVNVHMGMKVALAYHYVEIRDSLVKMLTEHPEYKLVITGHSLGGGYATILYLNLQLEKKEFPALNRVKMSLFTFGAPAVVHFNQQIDNVAAENIVKDIVDVDSMYSFVHGYDIVPRLLGSSLTDKLCNVTGWKADYQQVEIMKNYKHVGNYYVMKSDPDIQLYPCSSAYASNIPPSIFSPSLSKSLLVTDHAMFRYFRKLRTAVNNLKQT